MTDKIAPEILIELIELGDRLTEDRLREVVVAEIENKMMDGVAQAYALEEADGDEKKARAYYTKHRVRRIRDLITQESIVAEQERAKAEKEASEKRAAEEKKAKLKKDEEKRIARQKEEEANKKRIEEHNKRSNKLLGPILFIALAVVIYLALSIE